MAKNNPITFVSQVIEEGKKTIWPDRATITRHTVMVVATLTIATLIFAGIDDLLQKLLVLAINK